MGQSVKQRIKEFIEYKNISVREFERSTNLSNGYVNGIDKTIMPNKLSSISLQYPELNTGWLITGEGSMLKSERPFRSEVTPVPESDYMMVEYIDLRASAGNIGGGSVEQLPEKHRRLVPKEFNNGNFLVVRVDGDSMHDGTSRSLTDGDEVLVKEVRSDRWNELPIRKTLFVIASREGNVLKQITDINKEQGYILCHSFNPAYEDFKLDMDNICQIFIVRKVVQKQISLT